jgi:hypothetical protein
MVATPRATSPKPQRIYIAGALSNTEELCIRSCSKVVTDYIQNITKMCLAASEVRRKGHYPYVPALDFLLGVVNGDWEEEDYRGIGIAFLEVCDAILIISYSSGARGELNRAKELGLIIYYSCEEVPDVSGTP